MVGWFHKVTRQNQRCYETKTYSLLRKHFRTVDHRVLSNCDDPSYHPLQNILNGVNYLQNKSRELWSPGLEMTIDVGRVKSKSKRNGYHVFNAKKPVAEGWTIYKVIRCCLRLSVSVFKKLMNMQFKVTIWKRLSYIARYFVSTLKLPQFFIGQWVLEQVSHRHLIQFRFS